MDPRTADYYDDNSGSLSDRYEGVDMRDLHTILLRYLSPKSRALEIGCGSGRYAAFMLKNGFDVTAVDASAEMLKVAVQRHPAEKWSAENALHTATVPNNAPHRRRSVQNTQRGDYDESSQHVGRTYEALRALRETVAGSEVFLHRRVTPDYLPEIEARC